MNRYLVLLGLSLVISSFVLHIALAADGDDGGCKNVASDADCTSRLGHCVPKKGKDRDPWMASNCAKACFYCDTDKCADSRDDCDSLKDQCDNEDLSTKGVCMKTCGTCPSAK